MKLNSFTSINVPKSSFLADDTKSNLSKKMSSKYRYNIRIEIGIIVLLLGVYFMMAYSFLEMSSGLLFTTNRANQTEIFDHTKTTIDQSINAVITDHIEYTRDRRYMYTSYLYIDPNSTIDQCLPNAVQVIEKPAIVVTTVFGNSNSIQKNTTTIIS